ncbi:uncharacterized protein LOC124451181 [Xenia sp. Carnegie-2017]|uniref:uncharacterized protein LOC124451181 n=1 Tax=Xenia sp. Carnegie-2017 TaxID=2897299 RepID=UPI001F04AE7D|nr:uncharacterized protein LOC124451181 [Xenia sp. Carnegie-2017]
MASPPDKLKIEANGSRLSKLLINKGTQALKTTLQFSFNFRSSSLIKELKDLSTMNKLTLLKNKSVISKEQWELLYPSKGSSPDIDNFDISLLTVLLRNICRLAPPNGGWDNPSPSDTSISANIARIKLYRNKVYGHITTTSVNDSEFEHLWQEISKALVGLGIQQTEIDEAKKAPLSPDEANHIELLKNWYEKEKQLIDVAEETKEVVTELKKDFEVMKNKVKEIKENMATKADVEMLEDKICSDLQKLRKCNFNGLIKDLNKKYLEGTRQWLFEKLDTWFTDKNEDVSNVMILIAGPGVGKSVFAAEVCRRYSEKKKLAASHFCRYNRSDYRNPRVLIESLAISMCDTISNFKSKLNEELQRNNSKESITDKFLVLLNNPLHSLEDHKPMLLVIDALDESQVDGKSELLELIAEEFDRLPKWIKIFITSRPELPVQKELKDMNPVEITIRPRDENNLKDLHKYLRIQLNNQVQEDRYVLQFLVEKCEGSFLYAYHAQLSLNKENIELTYQNIRQLVPGGLSSVYTKQFKRVKELLTKESTRNSVISETTFMQFLELLAACRESLPLTLLLGYLGFSGDIKFEVRSKIIEPLSQILPVYNDCLTVYHKSLIDWLKSDGYEEHEFTVDPKNGHKFLWHACEEVFEHIKSMNIFEDQMNTTMIEYALENGIYHLSECGENVDFICAVDVKVTFSRLMRVKGINVRLITIGFELSEIIKERFTFLKKNVLEKLLFHLSMLEVFQYFNFTYQKLLAAGYENGQISIYELPEFEQRYTLGTAIDVSRLDKWNDVEKYSGLFITARYVEWYSKDVFTAWNSLTLQRIDRRCVVDYQELQCTDKYSEFCVAEFDETSDVFQFPKSININSTKAKHVNIGFKPKEILTFGDVLVCKVLMHFWPYKDFVQVVRITKEYTLLNWGNTNNELYLKPWHTAEIPKLAVIEKFVREQITVNDLEFNCCISDSKQAVMAFCEGIKNSTCNLHK